jgi:hypothetical protein
VQIDREGYKKKKEKRDKVRVDKEQLAREWAWPNKEK